MQVYLQSVGFGEFLFVFQLLSALRFDFGLLSHQVLILFLGLFHSLVAFDKLLFHVLDLFKELLLLKLLFLLRLLFLLELFEEPLLLFLSNFGVLLNSFLFL